MKKKEFKYNCIGIGIGIGILILMFLPGYVNVNSENEINSLETFLLFDTTNENKYIENVYMCDSFALDLQQNYSREYPGNELMIFCSIYPENHVLNVINLSGILYVIEPQTDIIFLLNEYINIKKVASYSIFKTKRYMPETESYEYHLGDLICHVQANVSYTLYHYYSMFCFSVRGVQALRVVC